MKTKRICFKKPDARAGQMVELDELGADREIGNGTAEEVSDDEWNAYQRITQPRKSDAAASAPSPAAPAAKKTSGKGR